MDHVTLKALVLVLIAGGPTAFVMILLSTAFYFAVTHSKGTKSYVFSILAFGLLTVPVTVLLVLLFIRQLGVWTYSRIKRPSDRETILSDTPQHVTGAHSPKVRVYLVHGTFDDDAAWTKPGSALVDAIKTLGFDAEIERFIWDAQNSVVSRSMAAAQLGQKITESTASRNYIIAHSHGGAIVREMSHLRPDIATRVSGVCLLSTPFIYRKKIKRTSGNLFNLSNITCTTVIHLLLLISLMPSDLAFPLSLATVGLGILAGFIPAKRYRLSLLRDIRKERMRGTIALNNVRIFQAIGDEADSALRFVSTIHEGCLGIWTQLKTASDQAHKILLCSTLLTYSVFVSAGVFLWIYYPAYRDMALLCAAGVFWVGAFHLWKYLRPSKDIPQILVAAALPVSVYAFWLGMAKALAYGDWRLFFCPGIFVGSSETPTGDFLVRKFAPRKDGSLIHSTHSHPEAIEAVVAWLQASENENASIELKQQPANSG